MKKLKNLTIKSTNKFSIISIINWDTYQSCDIATNHQTNQQPNQQVTSNQPATNHKQEYKEHKNVKNKEIYKEKDKYLDCVFFTKEEYQKLIDKEGIFIIEKAIEILNNYKMSSGKKYKSDYHAMLNWVLEKAKTPQPQHQKGDSRYESPDQQESEQILQEANRRFREEIKKRSAAGKDNIDAR